jgi:hypothetical protein
MDAGERGDRRRYFFAAWAFFLRPLRDRALP